MGLRQSTIILPSASPSMPMFALTFQKPDTISLVLADNSVTEVVSRVCQDIWKRGFEYIGPQSDNSYQVIFKGNPFLIGERRDYAESIKRICSRLLGELYGLGYDLVLSSDLSRYTYFTSWFFERRQTVECSTSPSVCCVSLSSTDSLQLFSNNEMLQQALRKAVFQSYGPGVHDDRVLTDDTGQEYLELKLAMSPWFNTSSDLSIEARKVILSIFREFYKCGYRFYGSANLKGTADCMFFMYDSNLQSECENSDIKFSLISLNGNNCMRLLDCPRDVVHATSDIITKHWPHGLNQTSWISDRVHELVLGGFPWWCSNSDSITSRAIIAKLFETLLPLGWRIACSLDISRRINDKSIFILQSRSPRNMRHFCISFNDKDKIRLIRVRPDLAVQLEKMILGNWPKGIKREMDYSNSREIKLKGNPFEPLNSNEASMLRVLTCYLLNMLHSHGCRVIASSDISAIFHHKGSSGSNYPFDVHSWFLVMRD